MPRTDVSDLSFRDELPRLLAERGETLRALARSIGGIDHGYLSRMVSGKAPVNARHAERVAVHLGLPPDYFPEVREEAVLALIRSDARLRDTIYFDHLRTRRSSRRTDH